MSKAIGPGRLILIVGPSGAGKDTLIAQARAELRNDAQVLFPRRIVTRPASDFEDHDSLTESEFECARMANRFALTWDAHGHKYGIPIEIERELSVGRTLVCNVSRTIIDEARERYAHVVTVLVTAPSEVLARRLAERGRGSDGELAQRLRRAAAFAADLKPDYAIENVGSPADGTRRLVAIILDQQGESSVASD